MRHRVGRRAARSSPDQTPAAVTVTTAARSHSDDIGVRQRRYLAVQGIRVLCLLLAATVPSGWVVRGALLAGAVALPYVGVVMANAGPTRHRTRRPNLRAVQSPQRPPIAPPARVVDADPGRQ